MIKTEATAVYSTEHSSKGADYMEDMMNEPSYEQGNPRMATAVFKDYGFDPKFNNFQNAPKNICLRWRDIKLSIKGKEILKGISGHVSAGGVLAIMGPSGAGKSTLLNILSGRVIASRSKQLGGEVFVNGYKINPVEYRTNIAYVMQEDLLYATATARESLEFSAKLRLPASISRDKEKLNLIVDDLLKSLGLVEVQNTMNGSEKVRGLSGGEKKRVAIGVELVTNPSMLFLDEPTSGLDSFSAWKVVKILKALGRATKCAILCTIHQPSSEIFMSFESVMMMTQGRVMYNGDIDDLPAVMERLGRPIPEMSNPADFLMLIAQTVKDEESLPTFNVDEVIDDKVLEEDKVDEILKDENENGPKVGICTQAVMLAKREMLNLKRDKLPIIIGIFITVFLNLVFGVTFQNAANREVSGYRVTSAFGALVMIMSSIMFGGAQGPLIQFPLERGIFLREYRTGTYSAVPYLLAKILVEIPRALINPLFALLAGFFLIGFEGNFFAFIAIGWLLSLTVASYAVFLGSAVSNPESAQQFAPLIFVPQLLFAGIFVPLEQIPDYIVWVRYLCVLKYGINLAVVAEFGDCDFGDDELLTNPGLEGNCTSLLEQNDIDAGDNDIDLAVMGGVFILFRLASLVVLVIRARRF